MRSLLQKFLLLIFVFAVWPSQATVIIRRPPKEIVPVDPNPDAIIKKDVRWYNFDEKDPADACKYERPPGVTPVCIRWYAANMPSEEEKPKRIIVLEGINFDFDKYSIREDSEPILKANVKDLREFWIMKIKIIGHTDSIGTNKYNQNLSENRAKSVMAYFARHGVEESNMTYEGKGETQPVAPNRTSEGRFKNRRIEIHIL